jgi:hypothetical protein
MNPMFMKLVSLWQTRRSPFQADLISVADTIIHIYIYVCNTYIYVCTLSFPHSLPL